MIQKQDWTSYSKVKVEKKKSTHSNPVLLFLRPGSFVCFVRESVRQSEGSLFFMKWNSSDWPGGGPALLRQRLMKGLGSHASGFVHVTQFHCYISYQNFSAAEQNSHQSGRICIPHGGGVKGLGGWYPFRFFFCPASSPSHIYPPPFPQEMLWCFNQLSIVP